MTQDRTRPSKRPARRSKRVDAAFVEAAALSYLDRFDATTARLRQVLLRRCRTVIQRQRSDEVPDEAQPKDEVPSEAQLREWVDALLQRFGGSGLVDDRRFAENALLGLRARGTSRRGIALKLRQKGVPEPIVDELLAQGEEQDELAAARKLVKRRRLGPHRRGDTWQEYRRKDLATLARAGFSFDIATRALAPEGDEF